MQVSLILPPLSGWRPPSPTFVSLSRFKDFREPPWSSSPYDLAKVFWVVLAARLAFVIVFQVGFKDKALIYL